MSQLNVENREWVQFLMGIGVTSKPMYDRTIERYDSFCRIESIIPESIESVGRFVNYVHFMEPIDGLTIVNNNRIDDS